MKTPRFHPLVEKWFGKTYGAPTPVQTEAWPHILSGEHTLALAPTGSGKTLTAFLAAISRFVDGSWDPAELCCLYVSPLKALNEDIRRNLEKPLAELAALACGEGAALMDGKPFPAIRAATRSGDTPQAERRRFLSHPPSILAVTPESLAILLLNPRGRAALSTVKLLVLDEIHAVMGTRRGAFLSCQVDRLVRCAGEFQRVALSATVRPPETAAEFSGGGRPVLIVNHSGLEKKIDFRVEFPPQKDAGLEGPEAGLEGPEAGLEAAAPRFGERYSILVDFILERIINLRGGKNTETTADGGTLLVFTDSRRRAERISFLLNKTAAECGLLTEGEGRISLCHHGSLSKEIRAEVEQSLAAGRIPCVVATSSLELGIDIGAAAEVILAGGVSGSAQALQRIGRAGHGVGETSRARMVPFHGIELILAAALSGAVEEREIEETRLIKNPLDILAQLILALVLEKPQTRDELFSALRGFAVFSSLERSSFEKVIDMLAGRYFSAMPPGESASIEGNGRLSELRPRLYIDVDGTCRAAKGTAALLYSSGGVIPNRGLYSMRLADGTKIGELDEEFVFERRPGDNFDFGSRSWRILEIGAESITVSPSKEGSGFQPFWKADSLFRSPVLTRRILDFFDAYEKERSTAEPANCSAVKGFFSDEAAGALGELLESQRKAAVLPGLSRIPVEIIDNPAIRADSCQAVFHSFRGSAVNYPLAYALAGILEEECGTRIEAIPDDNAVVIIVPRIAAGGAAETEALLRQAAARLSRDGEGHFFRRLESSGVFGAAFREAAECSLLIPRGTFGRRVPLWLTRQRAKRLFDKTSGFSGFPVSTEAWRICLEERFDMNAFRSLIEALDEGGIRLEYFTSNKPSPFARDFVWKETSTFMYEYDERPDLLERSGGRSYAGRGAAGKISGSGDTAIDAALAGPFGRPEFGAKILDDFGAKLRREIPGWTPEDGLSLAEWVRERIIIPHDEWKTLLEALPEELRGEALRDPSLGSRIVHTERGVLHTETAAALKEDGVGFGRGLLSFLGQWLRYEGPVSAERTAAVFGSTPAEAEDALEALAGSGEAAGGIKAGGEEGLFCDADNFGFLLRIVRKKARPEIRERPASLLAPFLALRQGIISGAGFDGVGAALHVMEHTSLQAVANKTLQVLFALSCRPAPLSLWETEIFPVRCPGYGKKALDEALADAKLLWFGNGKGRIGFCAPDEVELIGAGSSGNETLRKIAAFCSDFRDFWEIRDELELRAGGSGESDLSPVSNKAAAEHLWEAVWEGLLSSDSFEAPRRALERGFVPEESAGSRRGFLPPQLRPPGLPRSAGRIAHVPSALKKKWREGAPVPGKWFSLFDEIAGDSETDGELSELEKDELNQDRVRILLRRWGVIARPFLEHELPSFSWSALLPAMRRMELAGELVSGRFFEGVHSPQFAVPSIGAELEAAEDAAAGKNAGLYWMNAADPASPAGLSLEGLDSRLPQRSPFSRLCFYGGKLIAASLKSGKELELSISRDDKYYNEDFDSILNKIIRFVSAPRARSCHPVKKISLETINKKPAAESPLAGAFKAAGFISDRGSLVLW